MIRLGWVYSRGVSDLSDVSEAWSASWPLAGWYFGAQKRGVLTYAHEIGVGKLLHDGYSRMMERPSCEADTGLVLFEFSDQKCRMTVMNRGYKLLSNFPYRNFEMSFLKRAHESKSRALSRKKILSRTNEHGSSRLYYPFGKGPGQHIIRCLKNRKCENGKGPGQHIIRCLIKIKSVRTSNERRTTVKGPGPGPIGLKNKWDWTELNWSSSWLSWKWPSDPMKYSCFLKGGPGPFQKLIWKVLITDRLVSFLF